MVFAYYVICITQLFETMTIKILLSALLSMVVLSATELYAKECKENVNVGADVKPESALDSVASQYDSELLDEVVVTAKKPLVQTEADKVTYNMDEDPSAQTANVLDAMRKVPMLSVDAEGNIKLKGQSGFKIYVNGKPDPSVSSNYKDVLRAMPASSIKKIEVITEPGAKYDAEGVGGIINIVTTSSSKLEGYAATLSLSGSNRQVGGNLNLTGKLGNVSMSMNYGHNNMLDSKMSLYQSIEYINDPVNHRYNVLLDSKVHNNFDYGSLQLAWEPDTLNLFTVNANLFRYGMPMNSVMKYSMDDIEGAPLWSYRSDMDLRQKYLSYTVGTNWQHNFHSPEHNIVALYQYNYNSSKREQTYVYTDYWNYPGIIPGTISNMSYPNHEHTFQLDYTFPFLTNHKIEAGGKYIMRRNYGNTEQYVTDASGQWIFNPDNSVDMNQHQDVSSLYAAYIGKLAAFTIKGGVRYEHAHLSSKFKTPGHTDFARDLDDVVPNAMVSYNFPDNSSMRASYNMRISRPGVEQLNPYRNSNTPMSVEYGNPNLTSQKSNTVALTYSNFMLPVQMNVSVDYTHTKDMILNYTFLGQDNIINTTYGNIGQCRQTSIYAYLAYNIIRGMKLSVNGGGYYSDYRASAINAYNNGWGWHISGNVDYEMPWNLDLSLYGGGGNGGATFQGRGSSWSYHGLGITKSMLTEKRLRISVTATGIFTPTVSYTSTIVTPDMIISNSNKMHQWSVGLSVSYRLGSFNAVVKQTSKSITNDDRASSSKTSVSSSPR